MQNNRTIKKFAWLPTKVKILNNSNSNDVIVWFSDYFQKQSFVATRDFEWGWVTDLKYLHFMD